jgi:hypothetical protein
MWGPGLCGAGMWGFWWIFPLVGALVCLALIVMAFRFVSTGRGFSCVGGHGGMGERPDRGDASRNQHAPRGDHTDQESAAVMSGGAPPGRDGPGVAGSSAPARQRPPDPVAHRGQHVPHLGIAWWGRRVMDAAVASAGRSRRAAPAATGTEPAIPGEKRHEALTSASRPARGG